MISFLSKPMKNIIGECEYTFHYHLYLLLDANTLFGKFLQMSVQYLNLALRCGYPANNAQPGICFFTIQVFSNCFESSSICTNLALTSSSK